MLLSMSSSDQHSETPFRRVIGRCGGSGLAQAVLVSAALLLGGAMTTASVAAAQRLISHQPLDPASLPLSPFDDFAATTVLLVGAVLLLEVVVRGWKGATISNLLDHGHAATRGDMIWFVLDMAGFQRILALITGAGTTVVAQNLLDGRGGLRIAADWPIWLALPVAVVVTEFCQYWAHRTFHSRLFWPFHGMHHGAKELTPLAAWRTHPVENVLLLWTSVVPMFLLGITPEVFLWIAIIGTIVNAMSHSRLVLPRWVESYILVGPRQHHIHHSASLDHRDKNFGSVLPVFDHLFGTWCWEDGALPATGVADEDYDSGNPLRDFANCYRIWWARLPGVQSHRRELRPIAALTGNLASDGRNTVPGTSLEHRSSEIRP